MHYYTQSIVKNTASISRAKTQNIHFVGIGGAGMSGIAEVLHNLGYQISGSDLDTNQSTIRLAHLGCVIYHKHHADNLKNVQLMVVSSAIEAQNPELIYARAQHIPMIPRSEMLADLMRFKFGIAVAGTHGKTTVTSLIAHLLSVAELDPTYIIGGILNSLGHNAKLGKGRYLIAEADESDASFLHLQPTLSVITNIDRDHMDTYQNDEQVLRKAFVEFSANLPFYGTCVVCSDDGGVRSILADIHRSIVTYGFGAEADVRAINVRQKNLKMQFEVVSKTYQKSFPVCLNLIGKHNILNALAAISVACELGVTIHLIQQALENFGGIARRLDYHGVLHIQQHRVPLFDDYGHHPNEIAAIFESLKNTYPDRRLVVIFQPHRYSRTQNLLNEFVQILAKAEVLILLDIYPASEQPIAGVSSAALSCAISNEILNKTSDIAQKITAKQTQPFVVKNASEALALLPDLIQKSDVLLILGAGDIDVLPELLLQNYAQT